MISYSIIFLYLWHMKSKKTATIYLQNILLYISFLLIPSISIQAQKTNSDQGDIMEQGVYQGGKSRGVPHGKGVMSYNNGDQYVGSYVKGKRQGKGIYTYVTGEFYDGDWKNDMKNGRGIFQWKDGSRYDGFWSDNKRIGKGEYKYAKNC